MSGSISVAISIFVFSTAMIVWVLKPLGIVLPEKTMEYVYAAWGLLAIAITFAIPSRYALTGYTQKDVIQVVERLPDLLSSCSKNTLPAIQSCLQRDEEDTKARLTTIKWVAGITAAIAVYLGQKGLDAKDGGLISYAL